MSQDEDSGHQQPPFKAGTIKSLKLVNFMCHESFELSLGPRVNFVIGPNGSGKSALLTALVVVLGGRATTTSRARSAKDFVMYGKNFAKITLVLHNYDKVMDKEKAFKPDEYGKHIIIEKVIYKDDASKLTLKNDKGKRISERKQELDEILDHFSILINNPICILNQEVSKTFLHSKRPEDKYQLFMKATNLEQIEQDYEEAKSLHNDWNACNTRKSVGFKMLDNEYQRCKEQTNFLMNRVKLQHERKLLEAERAWALVEDQELKRDAISAKIEKLTREIDDKDVDVVKRQEKIKSSEENINIQKNKIVSCREECEASRKKVDGVKSKETKIKSRLIDINHHIDSKLRQIERLERDKVQIERSIAKLKKQFYDESNLDQDNERRTLEIERLERDLQNERARDKSIKQHTEQLHRSMNDIRGEYHKANMRVNNLGNDISGKQALLRRLKGGRQDQLRKFGDFMPNLVEQIELEHRRGTFGKKPIGPMGNFIKMLDPDAAAALEAHLGRNAHAFACDNVHDMQKLSAIIKRVMANVRAREPIIITRKFGRKHDTSTYRAAHPRFKTLLDCVEIDEPAVYNTLVDRTSLESVLFIPNYTDAENTMITPSEIPKHARCAYTKDCFVMYPRTAHAGYRSVATQHNNFCLFAKANVQVAEVERELQNLEADKRDAQASAQKLKDSLDTQNLEYQSNLRETNKITSTMRGIEEQLLKLKTTLTTAQPEELKALDSELDRILKSIVNVKKELEKQREILASAQQDLKDAQAEREAATKILQQREKDLQIVQSMIVNERTLIKTQHEKIEECKKFIVNAEKENEQEDENLREIEQQLISIRQSLMSIARPPNVRTIKEVKEAIRKVDIQLNTQIDEDVDPDQMMPILQKRMTEIEGLKCLKDHNISNFELSKRAISARDEGFALLRKSTISNVTTTFSTVMRAMGMNGQIIIHLKDHIVNGDVVSKAKTLEMHIDTTPSQRPGALSMNDNNVEEEDAPRHRASRSQPAPEAPRSKRPRMEGVAHEKENMLSKMTDTRSLSGGERSFSTVAFVLALWHHCSSPFKLMDEIDVFMDMVTRRLSYNSLIKFAEVTENPGQFIFFSPLELPKIDDDKNLVRVFEMPRIIRKGPAQSMPVPSGSRSFSVGGDQNGVGDDDDL